MSDQRTGMGIDFHRFAPNRALILGGVEVPHTQGLLGHSDADVLTHAICDALLGAAGLGDIGVHFPDTDEAYRGICSLRLLEHVGELLAQRGWQVVNVDATVMAEQPKLVPYFPGMQAALASAMSIPVDRINLKATTTEQMGAVGRGEGMSAMAVCLIGRA